MTPPGFAVSLKRAEFVVLPASAVAGSYGDPRAVDCERGFYLAMSDGDVGVRETGDLRMRNDGAGAKLEVPVTRGVPLPVIVAGDRVVFAARDAACVAWLVPLVPVTEEARAFVERACRL